ncbi:MAG: hypothetical protein ACQES5_12305, partial [Thermodesulfobacteriota bacterium]
MLKNLKLTSKLMLSIGIVVVISFVSTVSVITMKATSISKNQAMNEIDAVSKEFANEIRLDIEKAFGTARSLSYATQNMKKTDKLADRENLLSMMEGMLENNPGYLGIWTVWEPNAFDGQDMNYKGDPGHTDQG